jgi:hypothetical protein
MVLPSVCCSCVFETGKATRTRVRAMNQSVGPRMWRMRPREIRRSVTAVADTSSRATAHASTCVPVSFHSIAIVRCRGRRASPHIGVVFRLQCGFGTWIRNKSSPDARNRITVHGPIPSLITYWGDGSLRDPCQARSSARKPRARLWIAVLSSLSHPAPWSGPTPRPLRCYTRSSMAPGS